MFQYQEFPYDTLWQHHFPFKYWYNRLEKVNSHNDADRLEALYSLVKLTKIYSQAFSATVQNPTYPWYYLNNHVHISDVEIAFDALRDEGNTAVGRVSKEPNEMSTVNAGDDLNLDEIDAITVSLLGVPYEIDDDGTVEMKESPDLHRAISETILNAAEEQASLQQAFSQGFRVLPVSPDTIETVINSSVLLDDENKEPFQRQIEALREQYDEDRWPLTFAQLKRQTTDHGNTIQLRVFYVDAWTCYKFAEVVLDALFNLISPGSGVRLQAGISNVPTEVIERGANLTELIFGVETPIQGQPMRVVTEETFNPGSQ